MVTFKQIKREIKKCIDSPVTSTKEWEILLPHGSQHNIQKVISVCRKHEAVDWHIIFTKATEKRPTPKIRMYWDRKE